MKKKVVKKQKSKKKFGHAPKSLVFEHYLNRELTWLEFNGRVLHEAIDQRTPLLERLRFSNIFISNLDEFFMKRVGGLKNLIKSNYSFLSIDGKSPQEQIDHIRPIVKKQMGLLNDNLHHKLLPELKKNNIHILSWEELSSDEITKVKKHFENNIFPVLTPLSVDYGHPFPFISNLSRSIGICIKKPDAEEKLFARVKIPKGIPQWVKINSTEDTIFLLAIDQIILHNLDALFPGMEILSRMIFKITRNVDIDEDDESAEDLLELVEDALHEKRFSPIIRLEHEKNNDPWILNYLISELEITRDDVYELPSTACLWNFNQVIDLDRPALKFRPWKPITPSYLADTGTGFFRKIRQKDILIHHPYESFNSSVEKFISSAAHDPQVLAIKITLYRTNINGEIINSLIYAAEHGIQVACLIELKARFDEERNIYLAQKLENVGIHVILGLPGLKIHSKMCLVVRRESRGIQTYAHIGTGNYNSTTAQIYEDYSYFTANKKITREMIEIFNYLTGVSLKRDYKNLLVAPLTMRETFLRLIKEEMEVSKAKGKGHIIAKMNSLEDLEIINALYKASEAGVKIDLIVRGFCCLRPGVKGLSENIKVTSIIGRFLEHSRVYYFSRGLPDMTDGSIYIGSADWMYRNLSNRVEVITPIEDFSLKEKIATMLKLALGDKRQTWEMDSRGSYKQRIPASEKDRGLHRHLMDLAKKG